MNVDTQVEEDKNEGDDTKDAYIASYPVDNSVKVDVLDTEHENSDDIQGMQIQL